MENILEMALEPVQSQKLSDVMAKMILKNRQTMNQNLVTRFLQISHHPMAIDLFDQESRELLIADMKEKV